MSNLIALVIQIIAMLSNPIILPTPTPTAASSSVPSPIKKSSPQNRFISQINSYRLSQGLTPVKTDPYTCGFAATRAREIASSFNHDGFNQRISNGTLPYPKYSLVTENIAMNSNPNSVVPNWINSLGHAKNLLADTPYACVKNSGNYYVYESWHP